MRDTKHLEKHSNKVAESKKEKNLFRTLRKEVEAGAHGTLDYTIKEGVNKNKIKAVEAGAHGTLDYTIKEGVNKDKIADDRILKNKN